MNILISGAGVAGLPLAYWLKRYGFSPTIVERASSLVIGGYKVDVRGGALQVLRQMGIYETITAADTNMQSALLVDKQGKILQELDGENFGHRQDEDVEIIRGKLCQILRDHIPDVEIIFGDYIESIIQHSAGVKINFKYRPAREFDLVIGADGVHSQTRALVFGKEQKFAKNLGIYLSVFSIPNYLNLDRVEMQYSEIGRIASIWSTHNEPTAKASFGFISPKQIDLENVTEQHKVLREVYEDIEWELPKIFQMMPSAKDFYFDAAALICIKHWSSGRTVLVGDAAFCASPLSGQGISLALIGAYVLAGELYAAKGDHNIAFKEYEKVLRPFVNENQQLAIKAANLMRLREKKPVLFWLINKIMPLMPGKLIQYFHHLATLRIQKAANAICLKQY